MKKSIKLLICLIIMSVGVVLLNNSVEAYAPSTDDPIEVKEEYNEQEINEYILKYEFENVDESLIQKWIETTKVYEWDNQVADYTHEDSLARLYYWFIENVVEKVSSRDEINDYIEKYGITNALTEEMLERWVDLSKVYEIKSQRVSQLEDCEEGIAILWEKTIGDLIEKLKENIDDEQYYYKICYLAAKGNTTPYLIHTLGASKKNIMLKHLPTLFDELKTQEIINNKQAFVEYLKGPYAYKYAQILINELEKNGEDTEGIDEIIEGLKKNIDNSNPNLEYFTPTLNSNDNSKLLELTGKILGIVRLFGSIIAVLAIMLIGIKYMISSVEEKAKYKETLVPYAVGCILLFGIVNIADIIYNIANDL